MSAWEHLATCLGNFGEYPGIFLGEQKADPVIEVEKKGIDENLGSQVGGLGMEEEKKEVAVEPQMESRKDLVVLILQVGSWKEEDSRQTLYEVD